MHLKILGTRGEVKPSSPDHAKHSGLLVNNTLLLDLGEKEFLSYSPQSIFITHLHPDHAFFVIHPSSVAYPVYAPEPGPQVSFVVPAESTIRLDSMIVTAIPTHHSKKVKSSAYLVSDEGARILYTGDMVWIDKKYHHLFDKLDMVITDGSYIRKGGLIIKDSETGLLYGHTGIPDLIHLFRSFTSGIMFVHFGSWFYRDIESAGQKIAQLGKLNEVKAFAAFDGMEIDIHK